MNGRLLAFLACLLVLPLSAPAAQCVRGALVGEVTYVRDGDTIELGDMAIRLSGLAAPEWDEPGGTEAREAMIELVRGRTVRSELDGTRTYDRCAGVCCLDGADVSEVMVHRGLARDCPRYSQGRYAKTNAKLRLQAPRSAGSIPCPGIVGRDELRDGDRPTDRPRCRRSPSRIRSHRRSPEPPSHSEPP